MSLKFWGQCAPGAQVALLAGPAQGPRLYRNQSAASRQHVSCKSADAAATGNTAPQSASPATPDQGSSSSKPPSSSGQRDVILPKSGYFSLADPNREVYSKAGSEKFDPSKRGGRYQPEFIWNTDWREALKREESLQRQADAARAQAATSTAPKAGAVSFSRLAELNDLSVDMSASLTKPKAAPQPVRSPASSAQKLQQQQRREANIKQQSKQTVVPLPRGDIRRLERSGRVTKQTMLINVSSDKPMDLEAKAAIAAKEAAEYEAEKQGQRSWATALAAIGAAAVYVSYSRDVCASYVLGALGGLLYLRLLGRSVDSYGSTGMASTATGMVGNQRLLIPIILALVFNRWNALYAEDTGLTLNFFAIVVGFLTYKVAVVARQGKQVLDNMTPQPDRS